MQAPVDITYLADSVLLLRYFEARGRVRRALSVIKKRTGGHETTIREYRLGNRGLSIGEPLEEFQGVLRGVPNYAGSGAPLLPEDDRESRRGYFPASARSRAERARRAAERVVAQGNRLHGGHLPASRQSE